MEIQCTGRQPCTVGRNFMFLADKSSVYNEERNLRVTTVEKCRTYSKLKYKYFPNAFFENLHTALYFILTHFIYKSIAAKLITLFLYTHIYKHCIIVNKGFLYFINMHHIHFNDICISCYVFIFLRSAIGG